MKRSDEEHVEDRLHACLDGEMTEQEADAVREHCDVCLPCRRALDDWKRVCELMRSDTRPEPLAPVWPAVYTRLHGRMRAGVRVLLAFGTSVAAILGFLLGLFVGAINVQPPAVASSAPDDAWSAAGAPLSEAALFSPDALDAGLSSQEQGDQQ